MSKQSEIITPSFWALKSEKLLGDFLRLNSQKVASVEFNTSWSTWSLTDGSSGCCRLIPVIFANRLPNSTEIILTFFAIEDRWQRSTTVEVNNVFAKHSSHSGS